MGIDLLYPALQALADGGCEVMRVFSCPVDNKTEFNIEVREFARVRGIPYSEARITREDVLALQRAGCDALICGGYYYRIPVIEGFCMLNIHPSPLPLGRGSWPMPLLILHGYPEGGVTLHKMTDRFDEGDIVLQRRFSIDCDETLDSYMEKVYAALREMLPAFLRSPAELCEHAQPQGKGEYWPLPTNADMTVRANMTVREADRILRAFLGFPCYYQGKGVTLELLRARAVREAAEELLALPLADGVVVCRPVLAHEIQQEEFSIS